VTGPAPTRPTQSAIERGLGLRTGKKMDRRGDLEGLMRRLPAAHDKIRTGLLSYIRSRRDSSGQAGSRSPGPSRSARREERLRPLVDGLHNEAALVLMRILFVLYADGRGLLKTDGSCRGRGEFRLKWESTSGGAPGEPCEKSAGGVPTYRLWHAMQEALGALGDRAGKNRNSGTWGLLNWGCAAVADAYLGKALGLLCSSPGSRRGARRLAYARLDLRGLGDAYELVMDRGTRLSRSRRKGGATEGISTRKAAGRYYTPDRVVKYVVKTAVGGRVKGLSSRQVLGIRVLDPAMGSGHFLLETADFLAVAYGRARAREGKAEHGARIPKAALDRYRRLVIERCLYGVDVDPGAVELARSSLWLLAGGSRKALRGLCMHIKCGNALLGVTFKEGPSDIGVLPGSGASREAASGRSGHDRPFNWGTEFPEVERRGRSRSGFDVVIGNPPYVSFSGRQKSGSAAGRIAPSGSGGGSRGWPSSHGLFILRAVGLGNERGTISFIVPAQVGFLDGYGRVRSGLLDVYDLLEIRYWGEDVFRGVTTPALTFIAARRRDDRVGECRLVTAGRAPMRFTPKADDLWYTTPCRHILDRMAGLHGTVAGFTDPGVHTGNAAAGLLLSRPKPGSVPIIEGRQVRAFCCDPPRRWLDLTYKPSGDAYFRISDIKTYKDTDILIRQTASRPVAARHTHRCRFRNSVLALKAPRGFSVEYLLGVLNSDAAAALYRAYSPETLQRVFPQMKVRALRRLPIPDPRLGANRELVARIETTVRTLEAKARNGQDPGRLAGVLNELVRALYGLQGPHMRSQKAILPIPACR
jgi:hypothetical protein